MFLDQLSCKNTETQTQTHIDTSVQKALECRNIQASGKKEEYMYIYELAYLLST